MITPKERAVAALELREPKGLVPHFELEFQLFEEFLGKRYYSGEEIAHEISKVEKERKIRHNAALLLEVACRLDYSIIRPYHIPDLDSFKIVIEHIRQESDDGYLIAGEADGTFGIPSGKDMMEFVSRIHDDPHGVKEQAGKMANDAIERGKKLIDLGAEVITMCGDYCFNDGPFLSPGMFSEFVTPYLYKIIQSHRKNGAYVIKHTDGNIMPIIDQLLLCEPHGLHSLDPMAGVDLSEIKKLYGHKVCLCGNVNCAILQTGTKDEVIADTKRSLKDGMSGGGYIFCSSNCIFKGVPLDNYLTMLDVRKEMGVYQ